MFVRSVTAIVLAFCSRHSGIICARAFEGCPVVDIDWEEAAIQIFNGRSMFSREGTMLQRQVVAHILSHDVTRPFDCVEAIAGSLLSYSQAAVLTHSQEYGGLPLAALRLGYAFVSAEGSFPNCTAWPLQERDYHEAVIRLSRRPFLKPICTVPETPSRRVILVSRCMDSELLANHKGFANASGIDFAAVESILDVFHKGVLNQAVEGRLDWMLVVDCKVSFNATSAQYREPCVDHDVVFGEDAGGLLSSAVWFRVNEAAARWLESWVGVEMQLAPLGVPDSLQLQYALLRGHVAREEPSSTRSWPDGVESVPWMVSSTPSPLERFNLTSVPMELYATLSSEDALASMLQCS